MSNEIMLGTSGLDRVGFDVQISTAKKYPRDVKRALEEAITMATMDEETAESCIYSVPRGKTDGKQAYQKGESIRLAEILMSAWGNMHVGARILGNDGKVVTGQGAAWDLEKNTKIIIENQRKITNKEGKRFSEDMVVVTGNASCSIALRNAILRIIPKTFARRVYDEAVKFAIGKQKPLIEKVKELFLKFKNNWSIDEEKILKYFDKKTMSDITQEEAIEMIGIGTSIKEGNISIDKAFIQEEGSSSKVSELDEVLNNKIEIPAAIEAVKVKPPKASMEEIFENNSK